MEARYDLIPLSPADLAHELNSNPTQLAHDVVLIDVRPNGQYCSSHIRKAENLNFSNILLRRLLKRVITLDAVISSPELAERVCGGARGCAAQKLIFYDTLSTAASVRNELAKHVEAIYTNRAAEEFGSEQQARVAYFVDGKGSVISMAASVMILPVPYALCPRAEAVATASIHGFSALGLD